MTRDDPSDRSRELARYLTELEEIEAFSGVALLSRDDEVVFERAVGLAEIANRRPVAVDTIFWIGSLTKPISAVAVLQLQDQGRLSIDDRVCNHVPGCPESWSRITILQLLTHTSGIPNFTGLPDYHAFMQLRSTPDATLDRVRHLALDFEPGSRFAYSNSGYVLIGFLLETVSGGPYMELLSKNILRPLGMQDTGCDMPSSLLPRLARGYELEESSLVAARWIDPSVPHAAGGLYSTVEDLRRFATGLFGGMLLSRSSLELMLRSVRDHYAIGWMIGEHHGHRMVWHSGGIGGFSSHLAHLPEERMSVIVLSNQESGTADRAARALASIALHEPHDPPGRPATVEVSIDVLLEYVGEYEVKPEVVLAVSVDGGRLYVQSLGRERFFAAPESETRFRLPAVDAEVCFHRDENGASGLTLRQHDREFQARKRA